MQVLKAVAGPSRLMTLGTIQALAFTAAIAVTAAPAIAQDPAPRPIPRPTPTAAPKPEADEVPAPVSDRTVFSTLPVRVSDRLQSSGEVIGREGAGGVRRGEVEAAPFASETGGPRGSGRLAAAYDRPGIDAPAGDHSFQLNDPVFVELPAGGAGRIGGEFLVYRRGPSISDVAQVMIPTGIIRVESMRSGEPALARIIKQFDEIHLDQRVMALEVFALSRPGAAVTVALGPIEKVVFVSGEPVQPSLQSYVLLSATSSDGVRVGDRFTLIDDSIDDRYPAPAVPAATAQVVKVTPFAVTAIVVDHDQPTIRTGMTARLTARTP